MKKKKSHSIEIFYSWALNLYGNRCKFGFAAEVKWNLIDGGSRSSKRRRIEKRYKLILKCCVLLYSYQEQMRAFIWIILRCMKNRHVLAIFNSHLFFLLLGTQIRIECLLLTCMEIPDVLQLYAFFETWSSLFFERICRLSANSIEQII